MMGMMARMIRPGPCRRPVRTRVEGLSRIEVKFGSSAGWRGSCARWKVWEKRREQEEEHGNVRGLWDCDVEFRRVWRTGKGRASLVKAFIVSKKL